MFCDLGHPQKREVNRKKRGVFEVVLPESEGKWLGSEWEGTGKWEMGRNGLPGEPGVLGNYTEYL